MNENKGNEIVKVEIGNDVPMVFDGGPTGLEGFDNECMSIPYLRIAQAGSDAMKPGHAKYIKGLQAGTFFCPLTREVFGEEIRLVVVKFYRSFTIYDREGTDAKIIGVIPAEQFNRDIKPHCTRIGRDGKMKSYDLDPQGHRYVDNRNFLVMDYDHPERGTFLFPMSSSGIKPSKQWATMIQGQKAKKTMPDGRTVIADAPIWSSVWKLKIGFFQGDGNSWYQVGAVERLGWVSLDTAELYKGVFESMQSYGATDIAGAGEDEGEPHAATAQDSWASTVNDVLGAGAKMAQAQAPKPAPAGASEEEQTF